MTRLENAVSALRTEYASQGIDFDAEVAWDTKRRRMIALLWPPGAQAEAMQDHLTGRAVEDGGKWELMQAEIAAIKLAVPKEA